MQTRFRPAILKWLLVAIVAGCAALRTPRSEAQTDGAANRSDGSASGTSTVGVATEAQVQRGLATYYGRRFTGRRTASGEHYDPNKLTAAHRTLPFGSWVEVRRRATGRRVVVRINDRGPYVAGRIIDLSRRAAEELGIVGDGRAEVELEVLGTVANTSH